MQAHSRGRCPPAEILDRRTVEIVVRQLFHLLIQRLQLGLRLFEGPDGGLKGLLQRRLLELLALQPRALFHAPHFGLPIHPALSQLELREPMSRAQPIRDRVFAALHQVASGFFGGRRHTNFRQFSGPVESRQLLGIAAVRLDAVAGAHRR